MVAAMVVEATAVVVLLLLPLIAVGSGVLSLREKWLRRERVRPFSGVDVTATPALDGWGAVS